MEKPFFITGTDTDVGKTTVSKWLCYHLGYDYYKPIQTGECHDVKAVEAFIGREMFASSFIYKHPLCPQQAAFLENSDCNIASLKLPQTKKLIIEGAGGIYVPITRKFLMVDLIEMLGVPVLIVARSTVGTLNHTLLTIQALNARNIPILGVILNGPKNMLNKQTLEMFSNVKVLDELDFSSDAELKTRLPGEILLQELKSLCTI